MALEIQYDAQGAAYLAVPHALDLRLTAYTHRPEDVAVMTEISNAPEVARWSYMRPYPCLPEHSTGWLDLWVPQQQAALAALKAHAESAPPTESPTKSPTESPTETQPQPPTLTACPFVVIRHGETYIGDVSLVLETIPEDERVDGGDKGWVLAYALLPAYHGQGIASAAARQVMAFGEAYMGVETVYATIETANIPSSRLAQKLGFVRAKTVMRAWPADKGGGERELGVWVWRGSTHTREG